MGVVSFPFPPVPSLILLLRRVLWTLLSTERLLFVTALFAPALHLHVGNHSPLSFLFCPAQERLHQSGSVSIADASRLSMEIACQYVKRG